MCYITIDTHDITMLICDITIDMVILLLICDITMVIYDFTIDM